jgi:hypothetical protein
VRFSLISLIGSIAVATLHMAGAQVALAQGGGMVLPKTIEAGAAFSIQCNGSGKATLYIVGPGQVLKRDVLLGEPVYFSAGSLYIAGHFAVVLTTETSTQNVSLDVLPLPKPAELSFLAKPLRLQVGLHDGITGSVYVFDVYHNLIDTSMPVSFELSTPSGVVQKHVVLTSHGFAWTAMDSTAQQGIDKFVARMGDISSVRVVGQVPGDPCGLKMTARQSGQQVELATDQIRDCNGNAVPDGTIVTFTETYTGAQSTVDVPIKHGIAEAQMPAHTGATISVASGVVLGNQIRWEK